MKAKIIYKNDHWEIHLYNTLGELIDRIYVTSLELPAITEMKEVAYA